MNSLEEALIKAGLASHSFSSNEDGVSFSIDIWAKPGSKVQKQLVGESGELILYIKERPVEGAANKALVKTIGKIFGTTNSSIELTRGGKSKFKRFNVSLTFTERKEVSYYLEKINKLKKS